ncbi:MAG: hypothetical protein Fur0044_20440 [Anaerolineae bacterium]
MNLIRVMPAEGEQTFWFIDHPSPGGFLFCAIWRKGGLEDWNLPTFQLSNL